MKTPVTFSLMAALLVSGCSMAPKYARTTAPVPPAFPTGAAYPAAAGETLPALDRAAIFTDQRLLALMDQALVNNRDLRVAAANILRARSQFRAQRAAIFPQLDGGGSAQVML